MRVQRYNENHFRKSSRGVFLAVISCRQGSAGNAGNNGRANGNWLLSRNGSGVASIDFVITHVSDGGSVLDVKKWQFQPEG